MPVWDNVTSVTDIKLYYDFGEPSANIYGNERNCVALNIAFNAKKATELVDLSGQDLSEHVRLINFESSVPLARESQDSASNSLFYKREASDFEAQLMVQPHASQPDKSQMRARVRLYVYAKAETNFTSNIAVRFLLPSGKAQDTSAEQGFPQKLNIRVLRPLFYSVDDVTSPLEWQFVEQLLGATVYNAYIRPKDRSHFWKKSEFNQSGYFGIDTSSYLVLKGFEIDDSIYVYLVVPLCPEVSAQMTLFKDILPVACNAEQGALTVVKICRLFLPPLFKSIIEARIEEQRKKGPLKVRLYDQYGNVGVFTFTWEDPQYPKLLAVSADF